MNYHIGRDREYKEPVKVMDDVQDVSVSGLNTYAVDKNNVLWGWGDNNYSQIGGISKNPYQTPVHMMDEVEKACAGAGMTLILKKDGTVFGVGFNGVGYLGLGDIAGVFEPTQIIVEDKMLSILFKYPFYTMFTGQRLSLSDKHTELPSGYTATYESANKHAFRLGNGVIADGQDESTVTVTASNGRQAKFTIKIMEPSSFALKGECWNYSNETINVSNFTVTKEYEGYKISYRSTNPSVATVDDKGNVTGRSKGTTEIILRAEADSGYIENKCKVNVANGVNSIKLGESELALYVGKKSKLKLNVAPKDYHYDWIKWTSSNTKVAKVDKKGNITAKSKGTAIIKAEVKAGSSKYATCTVYVLKKNSAFSINKKRVSIKRGKSVTLKAVSSKRVIKDVKWKSFNKRIATVNKNGKVIAKSKGKVKIQAKNSVGKKAYCNITVK